MTRRRVENGEGSLEYPRFVRPVFTKDSKHLGKRKRSLGYLGILCSEAQRLYSKSGVGKLFTVVACQTNLPIGFSMPHSRTCLKEFDSCDDAYRFRAEAPKLFSHRPHAMFFGLG
ncbi:hypothetical protein TNCV_536901 [Trichonephila clavipes]|nr:hypothetical protein TNCV_536901 [Trichonephila clavipes]